MITADHEKLGAFYLGRALDPASGEDTGELVMYDSRDLTTHAVCVGMTGSGKTGLCLGLLEEAAIDGIPVIAIDPKGDIGNLALTFPQLRTEDFLPWIDSGAAARKQQTPEAFAADTAASWKKGLADWGQDGARIERLRAAAQVTIYTPGSDSGRGLSVLRSFAAPEESLRNDAGALRDRVGGAVAGLLALLGIDADPLQSREYIFLSTLLDIAWRAGRDLDLPGLIQDIQKPPFNQVGVFDLETFYPARERTQLAMAVNTLLASPGFQAWLEGDALDVQRLLFTAEGKPRISVICISHLNDAERMFVVTLLLNEVVAWMRRQSGTSSLRALIYMDEIFGYFPPTAMPPAKLPLLTLMKQARAFGVGVVLATQNPADLDYKGLANAGTWFIGRLQTERDKARVIEGLLSGSGAGLDKAELERLLANLQPRTFLMRNAHEDAAVLLRTRWAMSYLRGPLTLNEIRQLTQRSPASAPPPAAASGTLDAVRANAALALRERRDAEVERLRRRYAPKLQTLQNQLLRAQQKVERERSQLSQQKMQTALSVGATLLGALFGRKIASAGNVGRATTAARSAGRISRENQDVAQAAESLETVRQRLADLEAELQQEIARIHAQFEPGA